jgi:hypothetical protein
MFVKGDKSPSDISMFPDAIRLTVSALLPPSQITIHFDFYIAFTTYLDSIYHT